MTSIPVRLEPPGENPVMEVTYDGMEVSSSQQPRKVCGPSPETIEFQQQKVLSLTTVPTVYSFRLRPLFLAKGVFAADSKAFRCCRGSSVVGNI